MDARVTRDVQNNLIQRLDDSTSSENGHAGHVGFVDDMRLNGEQ